MSNPGSNKIEIPLSNETQTPRAPKTTQHQAQITVQNRRREYLARTPSYFSNVEHELAGKHSNTPHHSIHHIADV